MVFSLTLVIVRVPALASATRYPCENRSPVERPDHEHESPNLRVGTNICQLQNQSVSCICFTATKPGNTIAKLSHRRHEELLLLTGRHVARKKGKIILDQEINRHSPQNSFVSIAYWVQISVQIIILHSPVQIASTSLVEPGLKLYVLSCGPYQSSLHQIVSNYTNCR